VQKFRLHDRVIFPELNTVLTPQGPVRIEPKAMELLVELATHPGEVLSKAHILRIVWSGAFVCDEVVTNAISVLRRALGEEARDASLIQTVPKRGYRLTVWYGLACPGKRKCGQHP